MEFASLALVGAIVSVIVQFIKSNTVFSPRVVVVLLSVIAGALYYLVSSSGIWESVLQVILYANTVYLFLIKPFEDA